MVALRAAPKRSHAAVPYATSGKPWWTRPIGARTHRQLPSAAPPLAPAPPLLHGASHADLVYPAAPRPRLSAAARAPSGDSLHARPDRARTRAKRPHARRSSVGPCADTRGSTHPARIGAGAPSARRFSSDGFVVDRASNQCPPSEAP